MSRRLCSSTPLKIGPIFCPETSATNYQSTLRNIPEERRSHLHRGGSLKSLWITSPSLASLDRMWVLGALFPG